MAARSKKKSRTASKSSKSSKSSRSSKKKRSPKVGSDPKAAKKFGGRGDFGVAESNRRDREYVSQETKRNDPGAAQVRLKTGEGTRTSGAGSNASGPGSGSGGDLDTDIVGVGFDGDGISQSGPDGKLDGANVTEGGSEPFAAPGKKGTRQKNPKRQDKVRGSTVDHSGGDLSTTGGGLDSGSVSNPMARNDDSFAADINEGEADGIDN